MSAASYFSKRLNESLNRQSAAVRNAVSEHEARDQKAKRAYITKHLKRLVDGLEDTYLWDHQKQALTNTYKHFADPNAAPIAITVIPTGGGKTEVFSRIVDAISHEVAVNGNENTARVPPRTIILEPTNQLITQTKKKLEKKYPGLTAGVINKDTVDVQPLTLTTYDSFTDWVQKGKLKPEDVDVLIMDEAHRGLSEDRQAALSQFKKNAAIFAYSATPVFDLNKHIYTLLGEENEVINVPIRHLIDAKVLAPVVNYVLRIKLDGDLPEDEEERQRLFQKLSTEAAYNFYRHYVDEKTGIAVCGKPFLGYTTEIEHAKEAAKTFNALFRSEVGHDKALAKKLGGYSKFAEDISGNESSKEQEALIRRFEEDKTLGAFNAQLLVEGTDIPKIGAILNLSPTHSLVKELQRCGRGARINPALDPDDPQQTSFVLDCFFEVNGKVYGKPRFYFESIGEPSFARIVDMPPIGIGGGKYRAPEEHTHRPLTTSEDTHNIQYILRNRDNALHEGKTGEWIGIGDIKELPGGNRKPVLAAVDAFVERYDQKQPGIQEVEYRGQKVRLQKVRAGKKFSICIARDDWNKVLAAAGVSAVETLEVKTTAWLTPKEMRELPAGTRQSVITVIANLVASYDKKASGIQEIEYEGQTIRLQQMREGTNLPVCIAREDWDKVTTAAGVGVIRKVPAKTDAWLAQTDAKTLSGGASRAIQTAIGAIIANYDERASGVQEIEYEGRKIHVQQMQAGPNRPICVARADWDKIIKAAGKEPVRELPQKSGAWLSWRDALEQPGGQRKALREAVSAVLAQYDERKSGIQEVEYGGETIHLQQMQAGPKRPVCIAKADWGKITKAAKSDKLPTKTDAWLSKSETIKQPKGKSVVVTRILSDLEARYDDEQLGVQEIEHNGQTIRLQRMQAGNIRPVCVATEDWDNVLAAAAIEMETGGKHASGMQRKSIKPDSPHIQKRDGRRR